MRTHSLGPDHDVVVVGAGPAGLAAATWLARQGITVTVLDKRTAVSDMPRAVGVTVRQMELFRSWGLEPDLRARADHVDLAMLEVRTVADAAEGSRSSINVPDLVQSEVVSPTSSVRVAQDDLERVLIDELTRHPTATVRRGVEVVGLDQDAEEVRLRIRLDDGRHATVRSSFVVAADGVRSTVRHLLGIGFHGPDDVMRGVGVEFRAPLWPMLGDHRYALYGVRDPDAAGVLIPAGGGTRWQYGVVVGPEVDVDEMNHPVAMTDRIRRAVGVPDLGVSIVRTATFVAGAKLADRYSVGRVHLAGDAAHRVTPRGGNGLAMAVRDGLALGWRLAWVVQGWAPVEFLGGYEEEMRPLAAADVARAADPDGRCLAVVTEMLHDLGGRLQHAWVAPDRGDGAPRSTLDLVTDGLTVLTGDPATWKRAAVRIRSPLPVAVVELAPPTLHALGLRRDGAMLVRPDAVPVARWYRVADADRAQDELARAMRDLVGSPTSLSAAAAGAR